MTDTDATTPRRTASKRAGASTSRRRTAIDLSAMSGPDSEQGEIQPAGKRAKEVAFRPVYDYRYEELPSRVKDLISAHLAIEASDAKASGSIVT